jgi:hypothetical protein
MIVDQDMRGAVAVGQLHTLTAWQSLLVQHLRLWCDGPADQSKVRHDWNASLNATGGEVTLEVFDALIQCLQTYARRPLIRHELDCACLGADEAVFMQVVSDASDGHLDDAVMLAGLIALPAYAEQIAILAGQVGASFRATAITNKANRLPALHATHQILH